ncbi:Putrescine:proton symporter, AAT family [Candidatus Sulfopaludibacter sp. SbA3]|nr:Putrescine:proton symporter, AAT family [Candidatus Sulfopaludibacter sp. SbA3]
MASPPVPQTRLRRTLGLWDLILYGVIVIQPTAPMSVFGVLSNRGRGHVVTTILIAMVAMLFTAISYGRMARAYPSAGSAFTYVGQEINPALGYITGWSMVMDYMLNPLICIVWISQQAHVFAPAIPYWGWAIVFALLFTGLNLQGIRASARMNTALAAGMGVVIAIFFVCAARYIFGHPHGGVGFFTRPFYDPATFAPGAVLGGTSIAVLTYIGFDGISTLSEEAENPRRNILLATVLTCVVIGILSALEVYAAQLAWPASQPFPDETTAFVYAAGRTWGPLFAIVGFTLVVANFGSGMGAQLGAARLLFGMGRSNALPKAFFGVVDSKHRVPRNNVIFVGVVALAGAFVIDYDLGAQMLNFGALIAFMGVNAAALVRYYVRENEKRLRNLIPPALGFAVCLLLWLNLSRTAQIAGGIWMAAGIAFGAWKTHGFRGELVNFEIPADDEA